MPNKYFDIQISFDDQGVASADPDILRVKKGGQGQTNIIRFFCETEGYDLTEVVINEPPGVNSTGEFPIQKRTTILEVEDDNLDTNLHKYTVTYKNPEGKIRDFDPGIQNED